MANPKKRSLEDAPPNALSASLPQTHTQSLDERSAISKAPCGSGALVAGSLIPC